MSKRLLSIKATKRITGKDVQRWMLHMAEDFRAYVNNTNPTWKPAQVAQVLKQFVEYAKTPLPDGPLGENYQDVIDCDVTIDVTDNSYVSELIFKESASAPAELPKEELKKTFSEVIANHEAEKKEQWTIVADRKKQAAKAKKVKAHEEKLRRDKLQKETGTRRTSSEEAIFKEKLIASGKKYLEPVAYAKKVAASKKAAQPLSLKDIPKLKKYVIYTPDEKKKFQSEIAKKSKHGRYFTVAERMAYKAGLKAST